MTRSGRLLLLPLPVVLAMALNAPQGRAQQPSGSRFSFADTTLLRDTLGLHFQGIFEKADSLKGRGYDTSPDQIRALMIQYRLPLDRLFAMADSMGVPIDSVGVMIAREAFNPFAIRRGVGRTVTFHASTQYSPQRTSSNWSNNMSSGLRWNTVNAQTSSEVVLDRSTAGGVVNLQQHRNSTNSLSWLLSKTFSLSAQAKLDGFYTVNRHQPPLENESVGNYQLAMRTRPTLLKGTTSDFTVSSGVLSLANVSQIKRGITSAGSGRVTSHAGNWLSNDLSLDANGTLAHTRRPTGLVVLNTTDMSVNARGTLALLQESPAGLNVNYNYRNSRVEQPQIADTISRTLTSGGQVLGTLRLRRDNDRYVNLIASYDQNSAVNGVRTAHSTGAQARYALPFGDFDGSYTDKLTIQKYPVVGAGYGFNSRQGDHLADGTLQRQFNRKLRAKLSGDISLSQYRYELTSPTASTPTPRDSYSQDYRMELGYDQSEDFHTTTALDVSLLRTINLPSRSTLANLDTRAYRAEWTWSYRMLRGLTVSQSDQLTASYGSFPFSPEQNDLQLDYNAITTFTAVMTPQFDMQLIHSARQQPSGNYLRQLDGRDALFLSDEGRNYSLRASVNYRPTPAINLSVQPSYLATTRTTTLNGVEIPSRGSKELDLNGHADLNLKFAQKGTLTGTIGRSISDNRALSYKNGLLQPSPRSSLDFWNGSLTLTWDL